MVLPLVAVSVEDAAVHETPFHTPSWRPTIWALFGARATSEAVTAPRLLVVNV